MVAGERVLGDTGGEIFSCEWVHMLHVLANWVTGWAKGFVAFAIAVTCMFSIGVTPAEAMVQVKVKDVSYHDCTAEMAEGTVGSNGSGRSAQCFIIAGTTVNESGKALQNGDIFGRIFDANGDTIMANRGRLGSVAEIPIGEGHFEIRVTVPNGQPEPLQLKQFKAAGFSGKVRR
jgi:hypothetical protein